MRSSASSISFNDVRFIPCASPRSDVDVCTVLRSSTSGSNQLNRKATKEQGTATRNTVCTAWVTAPMYLSKKAKPAAVDLSFSSSDGDSVAGLNDLRIDGGTLASVAAKARLKTMA